MGDSGVPGGLTPPITSQQSRWHLQHGLWLQSGLRGPDSSRRGGGAVSSMHCVPAGSCADTAEPGARAGAPGCLPQRGWWVWVSVSPCWERWLSGLPAPGMAESSESESPCGCQPGPRLTMEAYGLVGVGVGKGRELCFSGVSTHHVPEFRSSPESCPHAQCYLPCHGHSLQRGLSRLPTTPLCPLPPCLRPGALLQPGRAPQLSLPASSQVLLPQFPCFPPCLQPGPSPPMKML